MTDRIACAALRSRITDADTASALIRPGETVATSGFTGSGYPKMVPQALARHIAESHGAGHPFRVNLWTGASTGPELDGALAAVDGIAQRLPYSGDPVAREKINRGEIDYLDMHLSQVAPMAWEGVLGPLDTAIIEVSGIRADGSQPIIRRGARSASTCGPAPRPDPNWTAHWRRSTASPSACPIAAPRLIFSRATGSPL